MSSRYDSRSEDISRSRDVEKIESVITMFLINMY